MQNADAPLYSSNYYTPSEKYLHIGEVANHQGSRSGIPTIPGGRLRKRIYGYILLVGYINFRR